MEKLKDMYKSFVMMFSEAIWIYYAIVIMTSVEWNEAAYFDAKWWIIAGIAGYVLNNLLINKSAHIILVMVNIFSMGYMAIQNWRSVVPQGAWGFGIFVSIGIGFIFVRSARLVIKQPTRQEILRRFEGNVIYYIVFALIITANDWINGAFHFLFIFGIINSLMAMTLTLQNHEEIEDNKNVKVIKVGQSGWFAGGVTILLIIIPIFTIILMLPSVRTMIYSLGNSVWDTIMLIWHKFLDLLEWLFSLFPEVERQGAVPEKSLEEMKVPTETLEESLASIPYLLIIGVVAILLIGASIWLITKMIKTRYNLKTLGTKKIIVYQESWWKKIKKRLKSYLFELKKKCFMNFSFFYIHPIYWYYYEIVKWGKKNGFPKASWETSKEYIERIIKNISENENTFNIEGTTYGPSEILVKLSNEYQAAYYGNRAGNFEEIEYKMLIKHLKSIRLSSKTL